MAEDSRLPTITPQSLPPTKSRLLSETGMRGEAPFDGLECIDEHRSTWILRRTRAVVQYSCITEQSSFGSQSWKNCQ